MFDFVKCRLVLHFCPKISYFELEEEEEQIDLTRSSHMFQSMIGAPKQPSPFAAKMVFRESDTSHSRTADSQGLIIFFEKYMWYSRNQISPRGWGGRSQMKNLLISIF